MRSGNILTYFLSKIDSSAVAKILQHRPNTASLEDWLERFLTWLPVCQDTEESVNTYSFLANLLEYGNVLLILLNCITYHSFRRRPMHIQTELSTFWLKH